MVATKSLFWYLGKPQYLIKSKRYWHLIDIRSKTFTNSRDVVDLHQTEKDFEKFTLTIQTSTKAALSNCRTVARRQLAVEQQLRNAEDPLRKLLGVSSQDLNQDMLTKYNVNTLQVSPAFLKFIAIR